MNFDRVWKSTRKGRNKMSQKWLKLLKKDHPSLAERALELNEIDNFEWKASSKKSKKSKNSVDEEQKKKKQKLE